MGSGMSARPTDAGRPDASLGSHAHQLLPVRVAPVDEVGLDPGVVRYDLEDGSYVHLPNGPARLDDRDRAEQTDAVEPEGSIAEVGQRQRSAGHGRRV